MSSFRSVGPIKAVKRSGIPHRLLFFDTETNEQEITTKTSELKFWIGTAYYVELDKNAIITKTDEWRYETIEEFYFELEELLKDKRPIYVFGHNIGFDLRIINAFHKLSDMGFESEPPIINERTFIWKVKRNGQRIFFLDTANYSVQSVAQLGEDLKFPKFTMPDKNAPLSDWFEYCLRDVFVIAEFMIAYIKFLHDNDLGEFKVTLASQTLTAWRKSFMNVDVHIHTIQKVIDLERESYHGGRVECFYIKEFKDGDFYNLDVNSMYPSVMQSRKLPTKLIAYKENPSIMFVKQRVSSHYVIAECEIYTDEPVYPKMIKNRLCFPIGNFVTTLHNSELDYAIKNNQVKRIYKCAIYDKAVIWKDYIDFFYNKRLEATVKGDVSTRYMCKIAMNSLYGKFGQTDVSRQILPVNGDDLIWRFCFTNPDKQIRGQVVGWFDNVIIETRGGETSFSFAGLAGAVTAEARMLLWEYIKIAKQEETFYCDTDSLIVSAAGFNALSRYINIQQLGLLKLEGKSEYLHIRGNKDYSFGDKIRTKGKTKNAIETGNDEWQQIQFEGVLAWFNRGGNEGIRLTKVTKHRVWDYSKGIVDNETGKVYPFIL